MKLVLFDIDGTLLWTDGAGRRAIHQALTDVFGTTGPPAYWFDGKTDPQIVRDLMRLAGRDDRDIDARMAPLLDLYVTYLARELARPDQRSHLFDGVPELLDALDRRTDVVLGLLTGNLAAGAAAKLRAVGLDPARFRVGAYGSDHAERPELPAIACRRAREVLGLDIPGEDVIVIGDTPADIDCGRAIGARTIGVATGRYGIEELATHRPSAVFADLRDTAAVLTAIVAHASELGETHRARRAHGPGAPRRAGDRHDPRHA